MTTLMLALVLPVLTRLNMLTLLAVLPLRAALSLLLAASRVAWRLIRITFWGAFWSAVLGSRPSHRARTAHAASLVFIVGRTIF
jgi:hypothetical protein